MFKTQNLYQNDPKWKDKPLGFASEKIGSWGCFLTSITMVLNAMGYNETPETVNDKLKAAGGFQDAFLIPSVVPYVFPNVMYKGVQPCENSPAPIGMIDAALAAGKPVILQVDWNKQAGIQTHFVVAKERQGDDYVLYDPYMYKGDAPDKPVLLTQRYKYNGATIETEISGVVWFDGYLPPSPPEPMKLPIPAEKFIVYVAEDDLALRADPSSAGYLWKRLIAGGELICLEPKADVQAKLGQQGKWLKVQESGGQQGYVAAWYVSAQKGVPAPTSATTASSAPTTVVSKPSSTTTATAPTKPLNAPPGAMLLTPTEEMSFRSQPTVSADTLIRRIPVTEQLICQEPPSTAIPKVGVQNQWLKASDANGKVGYLAAWYVKYSGGTTAQGQPPAPASSGPVKVKAAVEGVAFRKQPIISDATLIKRVSIGTEFTLTEAGAEANIGRTDQWLKAKDASGLEGYLAAWFVCR